MGRFIMLNTSGAELDKGMGRWAFYVIIHPTIAPIIMTGHENNTQLPPGFNNYPPKSQQWLLDSQWSWQLSTPGNKANCLSVSSLTSWYFSLKYFFLFCLANKQPHMLLIPQCCDLTSRTPSLVCPIWSVCIWVLSVVTLRNWLCSSSHQIAVLLWQCPSDSTHCAPEVAVEKKKKALTLLPRSHGGSKCVSGQSLLSLDRSYCETWYLTGVNWCWHRHS